MIFPTLNRNNFIINLTYNQIIDLGFFLGNKILKTVFLSSWLVYGIRKDRIILNLTRNTLCFRVVYKAFGLLTKYKTPIWFVCLNLFNFHLMRFYSYLCGEFCNNCFWNSGMISNFKKFVYFTKNVLPYKIYDNKFKYYFMNNYLISSRGRVPGLVFSLNPNFDNRILSEATKAGVPTLSIADTSLELTSLFLFFVGNNRSFVCIWLFLFIFVRLILIKKLKFFLYWKKFLYNVNRKVGFIKLLLLNFLNKKNLKSEIQKEKDLVVDSGMIEMFSNYYLERKYYDNQLQVNPSNYEGLNYIRNIRLYEFIQDKEQDIFLPMDYDMIKDTNNFREIWIDVIVDLDFFSKVGFYSKQNITLFKFLDKEDKSTYVFK